MLSPSPLSRVILFIGRKLVNIMIKPEMENWTQAQWKTYITNLITSNNKALFKSILVIHALQTDEEQFYGASNHINGVGFCKTDAEFLTGMAIKVKYRRSMTLGEYEKSKNKMKKYWKQLMKVSKGELNPNVIDNWNVSSDKAKWSHYQNTCQNTTP